MPEHWAITHGQENERLMDALLEARDWIVEVPANVAGRELGNMRYIRRPGGDRIWVEYKMDNWVQKTGRVALELKNTNRREGLGWALNRRPALVLFHAVGTGRVYVHRPDKVADKIKAWIESGMFPVRTTRNPDGPYGAYEAEFLLVPVPTYESQVDEIILIDEIGREILTPEPAQPDSEPSAQLGLFD